MLEEQILPSDLIHHQSGGYLEYRVKKVKKLARDGVDSFHENHENIFEIIHVFVPENLRQVY